MSGAGSCDIEPKVGHYQLNLSLHRVARVDDVPADVDTVVSPDGSGGILIQVGVSCYGL